MTLLITACSSNNATPTETSPTPTIAPTACLIGKWTIDVARLAHDAPAAIPEYGPGTATGEVTIVFSPKRMDTVYNVVATFPQPQTENKWIVTATGASASDYVATDSVITPTKPVSSLKVTKVTDTSGRKSPAVDALAQNAPIFSFTDSAMAYTCTEWGLTVANSAGFAWHAQRAA